MALAMGLAMNVGAQEAPSQSRFKDELRMPWTRGSTDFIRSWLVAGPIPCKLVEECLSGEAALVPTDGMESKRPDGSVVKWRTNRTWGDPAAVGGEGSQLGAVGYAFTTIKRDKAGKALLSLGAADGLRAWVNGKPVLAVDAERSWAPDSDPVEVDLNAGDNSLLIKVSAAATFSARVLESGAVVARVAEVSPSIVESTDNGFTVVTDFSAARADAEPVKITVIRAGGEVVFEASAR